MQALESLNDTQVNDFLSGKSPLNLTMRLGDHMMLIQLQLSTLSSGASSSSRSLRTSTPTKSSTSSVRTKCEVRDTPSPHSSPHKPLHSEDTPADTEKHKQDNPTHFVHKRELELLQNAFDLYRTITEGEDSSEPSDEKNESMDTSNCTASDISDTSLESEQSPIKSLSNLVSSPIDASASQSREPAITNAVRIKSLSDLLPPHLLSRPIDTTVSESREATITNAVKSNLIELLSSNNKLSSEVIPSTSAINDKQCPSTSSHTPDSSLSDDSDNFTDQSSFLTESTIDEYPMENLFNSAVDKGLFQDQCETMMDREISNLATTSYGQESASGSLPSFQSINEPLKNKRFQYLLHKTSKFKHPIGQSKQKAFMQSVVNKHKKRMQIRQESNLAQPSTSRTEPYITNTRKLVLQPSPNQPSTNNENTDDLATASTSKQVSFKTPEAPKKPQRALVAPVVDTKALLEASKNLTQKLKKLSKEVLLNKIDLKTAEESVRSKIGPGAVIESMKHHGKGIYSGTFSGTLNPALQDR